MPRRLPLVMPAKMAVKLVSVQQDTINPGANSPAVRVIRTNDCYDWWDGIGNNQARGFDQWSAMYERYCVVGYVVRVNFEMKGTTESDSVLVGMCHKKNTTTYAQNRGYLEHFTYPKVQRALSQYSDKVVLSIRGNPNKEIHVSNPMEERSTVNALVTSSPTHPHYVHIWAAGAHTLDDPSTVDITVTLTQIVVFNEPKQLGDS